MQFSFTSFENLLSLSLCILALLSTIPAQANDQVIFGKDIDHFRNVILLDSSEFERYIDKRSRKISFKQQVNALRKIAEMQLGINYCPFKVWSTPPLVGILGYSGLRKSDIEEGGIANGLYSTLYERTFNQANLYGSIYGRNVLRACDKLWAGYGPSGNFIKGFFVSRSDLNCTSPSREELSALNSPNITEEELPEFITKARSNDAIAQFKLGRAYLQGKVIDENYEKGYEWIKKSAESGYVFAQYTMSSFYDDIGNQDYKIGFEWLKKAAEQRVFSFHTEGLAIAYRYGGPGVEKNSELEKKWSLVSAFLRRRETCDK